MEFSEIVRIAENAYVVGKITVYTIIKSNITIDFLCFIKFSRNPTGQVSQPTIALSD
jgi:hypothetical protein